MNAKCNTNIQMNANCLNKTKMSATLKLNIDILSGLLVVTYKVNHYSIVMTCSSLV